MYKFNLVPAASDGVENKTKTKSFNDLALQFTSVRRLKFHVGPSKERELWGRRVCVKN